MDLLSWRIPAIPLVVDTWWGFTVVLIALIVFIWVIARLVTRVTENSDPAETDRQMLTAINDLHRKGDLSPGEFRSIKSQLVNRLQEDGTSSDTGSSEQQEQADSTERSVAVSDSTFVEAHETVVDSTTQPDLPLSTGGETSEESDDDSESTP